MKPPYVAVGFHTFGFVQTKFTMSLLKASSYEGTRIAGFLDVTGPYTDEARNRIVEAFLSGTNAEYLLMVDADIEFDRDAITKTVMVAETTKADVVWANYVLGNFSPSLFYKDENSFFGTPVPNLEPNQIYHGIYAGGTGWCLMRRGILEKMKTEYAAPWHWFDRDVIDSLKEPKVPMKMGEDMTFGKRVWELGGTQVGYTGITLIHHKNFPHVPKFMAEAISEGTTIKVVDEHGKALSKG